MPKVNHLAGIACPDCGHSQDLDIEVLATWRVSQAGPQRLRGKCEWNDDSRITCPICKTTGTAGTVRDFRQAQP
ncbi:hypothetical protein [Vreelandella massiliensis]|uniref:hypothetical protein n=1 Tax=Vreelandella massiliensis TaxID=1816686 RepID=UPI00096A632B|nr:hypothetical protein [Halomonas massiliensis]